MCCISNESALTLVHFPQLHPFAYDLQDLRLRDTRIDPQGRYRIFKNNPSKITLLLHRCIKKFLKIFQLHVNSIAKPTPPSPPPPPPPISKKSTSVSPQKSQWTTKRIVPLRHLVAIQRKVGDDLTSECVKL